MATPTFAPYESHRVAYHSHGAGPHAVVFIHGWCCNSTLWEPQQPLFAKFKRTILVDLLGHGNSDAPTLQYSQEVFARAVKAALDHAGVETAVFVSHSMGGTVTTMLLRLHPELVKGIVYVDSFLHSPLDYLSERDRKAVGETFANDAHFEAWVRTAFAGPSDAVLERIVECMLGTPTHVRVSCINLRSRPHVLRYDEIFRVPAVQLGTVYAEMDPFWKHHLPLIELQENAWKGCSHFIFLDQAERFNQMVERWIKDRGFT